MVMIPLLLSDSGSVRLPCSTAYPIIFEFEQAFNLFNI